MSQSLVRWALFLSEFNFEITECAGSANGKPNSLSRRPNYASCEEELSSDIPFNVLRPESFCAISSVASLNDQILQEYKNDKYYKEICKKNSILNKTFQNLINFLLATTSYSSMEKSMFPLTVVLPY